MTDDVDPQDVEQALQAMAGFDRQSAAIDDAERDGLQPDLPALSIEAEDAIVARVLGPRSEADVPTAAASRRRWGWGWGWAAAACTLAAAALMLWFARPPSTPPVERDAAISATLQLGGTARVLGGEDTPRRYGPGDDFVLQLTFETVPSAPPFVHLRATDIHGGRQVISLPRADDGRYVRITGVISEQLAPGRWVLEVRYGPASACSADADAACHSAEATIDVASE